MTLLRNWVLARQAPERQGSQRPALRSPWLSGGRPLPVADLLRCVLSVRLRAAISGASSPRVRVLRLVGFLAQSVPRADLELYLRSFPCLCSPGLPPVRAASPPWPGRP